MRKYLILILLMSLQMVARGQTIAVLDSLGLPHPTTAKSMRYWLDDDDGSVATVSSLDGKYNIDVTSLLDGLHTIHYHIVDSEDKVGPAYSCIFLKIGETENKAANLRYWYDDDTNVMLCNANIGVQQLDASGLLDGLHTLHYQVVEEDGTASHIASCIFLKMQQTATASKAVSLRYWYDDDTNVMSCNANIGVQQLDASGLLDGLHTLHYQVVGEDGTVSQIASCIFLKMNGVETAEQVTASKLIYWFDDQQETTTVETTDAVQVIDASALLEGLHTVHYMVVCSDGSITSAYSSIFLRMNFDTESTIAKRMRYWFDDEASQKEVEVITGTQTLDASHLLDGLHTVHYQLIDQNGASATPMSSIFLKMTDGIAATAQNLRYWFDDDIDVKTTSVSNGNQTLDVTGLLTGLHTLHYQLVDSKGNVCAPVSGLFLKQYDKVIENGENAITQYMYWMNDNSADNKKVTIDKPTSPYQLITLLPMIKAPIRSSSFQFEVKDGMPTIYAKNDLHVRFKDAMGYWADDSRSFVDYSVSETITDMEELQVVQTFARPNENQIKWFKFEAQYGDSIALKCNKAASIDMYNDKGTQIYSASGSSSVEFGGCHMFDDATYYVAVHDVTGTGADLTLSVERIDKYAIFEFSPDIITSEGHAILSFKGNGLDFAKTVRLTDGLTTVIADSLLRTATYMDATFYLNGEVAQKSYTLEVDFYDKDRDDSQTITFKDAITIEPPMANDIAVTVTRENRVGDPYPVQVHIKNTGNKAYVGIPFGLAFDGVDLIDEYTFENFKLLLSKDTYKNRDFFTYTDNILGTGEKGLYIPMILPYLGPYEELTYTVGFRTKVAHALICTHGQLSLGVKA